MHVARHKGSLTDGELGRGSKQAADPGDDWKAQSESEVEISWDSGADGNSTSTSHIGSSTAPQQAATPLSPLFQYFSLLASYHGALHIPRYWADLFHVASVTEGKDVDGSASERGHEWAGELISPVTEIDLSATYAGPTTLLALGDVLRVHCVTKQRSDSQRRPLSGKKDMVTLPVVMAPLWGAGSRRASEGGEVMCSLLPDLTTLRLTHLSMDFTVPCDASTLKGGNAVLRYMLEALQGHPSLKVLDVSGNPVAAALVPAISRLAQMTPSLTTLVLDDTLITDCEKKMLRAQCLLNELRMQRATADGVAATVSGGASSTSSSDSATQALWAAQMAERVFMAVERGASAVAGLFGRSTTLIHRYDAPQTAQANASSLEKISRELRMSYNACKESELGSNSVTSLSVADVAPMMELTYLTYDLSSEGGAAAVAAAAPPAGTTWGVECVEVVRCAFMSRSLAQRTVLGGRLVWSNVPKPLEAVESRDLATPSAVAVTATDLLLSLRQQVLPEPEAPPGVRRDSVRDPTSLTIAEENYWTLRKKQDTQWGYVMQKISENLIPVYVRSGQTLYVEGSHCDSIYLLPVSLQATCTYAEVQAGTDLLRVNRVLPGQWVGDAEVLDCLSIYAKYHTSTAGGSAVVPNLGTAFQRRSAVRIVTEATGDIVVWALPFPVAFFYLYAPYQLLHKQFVHRTPMGAFTHIHPIHIACVPVHLHANHGCWNVEAGQGCDSNAAPILCRYAFMSRHVLLLEEGEFVLRLPSLANPVGSRKGDATGASTAGSMEYHHLLSGVTVLTQPLLDLDAELRATTAKGVTEKDVASVTYSRGPKGVHVLGKEAALRRFRAAKIVHTEASTALQRNVASGIADAAGEEVSRNDSDGGAAELRQYRAGGRMARWRYAAIANEQFTALCPELRVALTQHSFVVHDV